MKVQNMLDLSTASLNLDHNRNSVKKKVLEDVKLLRGVQADEKAPAQPTAGQAATKSIESNEAGPPETEHIKPPKRKLGLASLVAKYLSLNLVKTKKVTISNWEKVPLDEKQLTCEQYSYCKIFFTKGI